MCMYTLVCLVNKYLSNCSSASLTNSVSSKSKMADTDAEVLAGHGAENGADASPQEEADKTNASRSTNASEGPPEESQVPRDEEEEDESEEDGPASTQVYKRPAAKKPPQMSMSDVQKGMEASSSKLVTDIVTLKKKEGGAQEGAPKRIEEPQDRFASSEASQTKSTLALE